ncbi:MAG: DUF1697 domain-containing protein [Erythrobacter sp.]
MAQMLALLGSINVGGNRITMADLKQALAEEGLGEVQTVGASGNVIFESAEAASPLEQRISKLLQNQFGIAACVVIRTRAQVQSAIAENPFHGDGAEHGLDKMVHSMFLETQPDQASFDGLQEAHRGKGGERMALGEGVLYLDYVDGVGRSALTGKFLERHLGCRGTARNMSSLTKILAKMD